MQTATANSESIHNLTVKNIDQQPTPLREYKGKVLLVVNVASKCGLTPQYTALQSVYEKYKDKGLVVLGFPCNQFGAQEPGTNQEIREFCSLKYKVTFPMFDKLEVNGANRAPLYDALAGAEGAFPGDIKWNFTKFLVGRDGKVLKRFEPQTAPDAPEVIAAIETALAGK